MTAATATVAVESPDVEARVSADVLAAVRPGWRVATRQAVFIRAVEDLADEFQVRCDGRRNLLAIAWVYARRTGWLPETSMVSSPSRALVMQLTGLSDATVKRWTCWMVHRGVMAQLEVGRLAQFRPMPVQDEGGRVSVYVLCTPAPAPDEAAGAQLVDDVQDPPAVRSPGSPPGSPVDKSDPSILSLLNLEKKNPYAGARASRPAAVVAGLGDEKRSDKRGGGVWRRVVVAGSRRDRLDLVARLQAEAPALRPCSGRELRSVLRPWLERRELGWTVAELLYAIDHAPDGRAYPFTATVRVPARWLAHRMRAWLNEAGQPLPSPRVAAAATRAAELGAVTAARAERAEQVRRIADEHDFGELIRAAAGGRYPALVEAIMADQPAGARLLPAAGAEALVRVAVRELTGPNPELGRIAAAVNELLDGCHRPGT